MNNKIIKILILSLAIVAIGVVVILTQNSLDKFTANQVIQPFDFEEYLKQKVDLDISGTVAQAHPRYIEIYDIITTEKNIQTNQGSVISNNVVNECYGYAFLAYWNISNKYFQDFFARKQKEWILNKRNELRREIAFLKGKKGCPASVKSDIETYGNYITKYEKALSFIYHSGECQDYTSYQKICKECSNYKGFPYSNVTGLQNDLGKVPSNAKDSWKKYILLQFDVLIKKDFSDDPDKSNFNREYQQVIEKAKSYEDNISNSDTEIISAKTKLNTRSQYWSEYFRNKLTISSQYL